MKFGFFLVLFFVNTFWLVINAHAEYSKISQMDKMAIINPLEQLFISFNRVDKAFQLDCNEDELKYCLLNEVEYIAIKYDSRFRNNILRKTIAVRAKEKLFDEAFNALVHIDTYNDRSLSLRSIAESYAESDNLLMAKKVALKVEDPRGVGSAIIAIFNSAKDIEEIYAFDLLAHVQSPADQSRALLALANLKFEIEKNETGLQFIKQSKDIAIRIDNQPSQSIALSPIAIKYAELQKFDAAIDIIIKMGGNGNYFHDLSWGTALSQVSKLKAEAGYIEEIHSKISEFENQTLKIKRRGNKDSALVNIIRAWASVGQYDNAINLLSNISKNNIMVRSLALDEIARNKANDGDIEGALASWDEAIDILLSQIGNTSNDFQRSGLESNIRLIAIELSKAGFFVKAKKVALLLNNDDYRNSTLRLIIRTLDGDEDYANALDAVEKISNIRWQGSALYHIATSKAKIGDYLAAIEIINGIQDEQWRMSAIISLINEL